MSTLTLENNYINFLYEGRYYSADITRHVFNGKITFRVFYSCIDENIVGKCELDLEKENDSNTLTLINNVNGASEEFIVAVKNEILKIIMKNQL